MRIAAAIALLLVGGAGSPAPPPEAWAEAEQRIRRLPPSAFPQIPAPIRSHLDRRGCTVPQAWSEAGPHNAIRGAFLRSGSKDWAILCSRGGRSVILVFPDGAARPAAEVAESKDLHWLQTVSGNGGIGYSRILAAVGPRYILDHREAFGGPVPAALDHDGIEDLFEGKASTIHYFARGRWFRLAGMD